MTGRRRRAAALAAFLAVAAVVYLVFSIARVSIPPPAEQLFGEASGAPGSVLQVYIDVLSFDPMRDTLEAQVHFATAAGRWGSHVADAADRDMAVLFADGDVERRIVLRRGEPMQPRSGTVAIRRGAIDAYPFDRYAADLRLEAYDGLEPDRAVPMRLRVIVWSRLPAWDVRFTRVERTPGAAGIDLDIRVRRPYQSRFFAVTLYAAMALMGGAGLTIGSLIFLGLRRLDTTFAAVLSAMIFSLPALRNILPGAPPLGVRADSLVFLWAQLAVVIGLTLIVITWARGGDRPDDRPGERP